MMASSSRSNVKPYSVMEKMEKLETQVVDSVSENLWDAELDGPEDEMFPMEVYDIQNEMFNDILEAAIEGTKQLMALISPGLVFEECLDANKTALFGVSDDEYEEDDNFPMFVCDCFRFTLKMRDQSGFEKLYMSYVTREPETGELEPISCYDMTEHKFGRIRACDIILKSIREAREAYICKNGAAAATEVPAPAAAAAAVQD